VHPPIDPERLLAQTAWVKRLAQTLARDAASAEDLVQDTFEVALRRPPADVAHEGSLRAWLATVARNLAFSRAQAERRRTRREQQRARAELAESEERLLEIEELRAVLVRAVLGLPDSSREVVVLHFFEELSTAEVAQRLCVPRASVHKRLRRALAELRAELDRGRGPDWRALCVVLAPGARTKALSGPAAGLPGALGGAWSLAGLLALLGAAAWFAWPRSSSTPLAAGRGPALAAAASAAPDQRPSRLADEPGRERRAEPLAGALAFGPDDPARAALRVRGAVRDEHGRPVAKANLQWFDEHALQHDAPVRDGGFAIDGLHAGAWIVASGGAGWRAEQYEIELPESPAEQQRDFTLPASVFVPVRLSERSGRPLLRAQDGDPELAGDALTVCATREPSPRELSWSSWQLQGFTGCARFWGQSSLPPGRAPLPAGYLGLLELLEEPPFHVALAQDAAVLAAVELRSVPDELVFALTEQEILAQRAGLRLRLLQPDGRTPASGGRVLLRSRLPRTVAVGPDGRVELDGQCPGPCLVSAVAPGLGKWQLELALEAGKVRDLGDVVLREAQRLAVRFELPDDPDASVRFVLQREIPGDPLGTLGNYEDMLEQRTRAAGRAEIPWPGPGTFVLRVLGVGDAAQLGCAPLRVEFGERPPAELLVRLERTQDLALHGPRDAAGWTHWLLSTREGLPCRSVSLWRRKPLRIGLPAGDYRIARIDGETGALGPPRPFALAGVPLVLELGP
jgi:RNA polymerase sigma-70 factor (ECF subfamily)